MEVAELAEPLEEKLGLTIEGMNASVVRQAVDGRILIRLPTREQEEAFQARFAKLGAVMDPQVDGVWVDLGRFEHDFH